MSETRTSQIAEAALRLLAREGAKGLTHRAVDAELSLAKGSTSYYYRTRAALLLAAAQHLLALDEADASSITLDPAGLELLLTRWLSPAGRIRSLARMELLLHAARDPSLRFMLDARERFIARTAAALRQRSAASTARRDATTLIALVDGLTLHGLVTGKASRMRSSFEVISALRESTARSKENVRRKPRA